jgi:hypothetical protein
MSRIIGNERGGGGGGGSRSLSKLHLDVYGKGKLHVILAGF